MKKVMFYVIAIVAFCATASAQSVIDADDQQNPNDFYTKVATSGKKAMPYPPIRQSDVIWERYIWRDIDFNERFNQFFYFPLSDTADNQGRTNLVNLIVRGVRNGLIPTYDDDDMKVEKDPEKALKDLSGEPIVRTRPKMDADGQVVYDEETGEPIEEEYIETRIFDSTTVTKIRIKERWFIEKQDTRQKVRIVGLAFEFDKELASGGSAKTWSFWIPMNDMRVRDVLVNANAYDENNDVKERSYDDIFIQRYFDSYIVRASNIHNNKISDYLTGVDAILESQRIEDEIYNLESDMWEY